MEYLVERRRKHSVSHFVAKTKMPTTVLAITLMLSAGYALAQSTDSSPIKVAPRYDLPAALTLEGVSSEEFELQFLTSTPAKESQAALIGAPTAPPALQVAIPIDPAVIPAIQVAPPAEHQLFVPPPTDELSDEDTLSIEQKILRAQTIPWWRERCTAPILTKEANRVVPIHLEQIVWQAMQNSPKVKSILLVPRIQRTDILSAMGEFDRRRFGQTNFRDSSDPVGNTLTTGGPSRLTEQFWDNSIGIRDRNMLGGKTELLQLLNARDSNSLFFQPNNQADTKLSLTYTQPLLRGAGRYYNTSSIRLAGNKTNQAIATANRELQIHTFDVVSTYWELVLQRYLLEQARHGQARLKAIKVQLQNREGRDLVKTQIDRATSAIQIQQGQIETAKANVLGLQESLRRLVNSPELDQLYCSEIIPLTLPSTDLPIFPIEDELLSALNHRGDLLAIQETIQAAVIQKNLAIYELRPQLDLDTRSYVRGLTGNNQFAQSYGNQFAEGRPTIQAGLTVQRPVGNRTAKANLSSRQQEIEKLKNDYLDELNKARADIITAILNANAAFETTVAAIESTFSTKEEVDGHKSNFENFFGENPSVSNILNELLDAENRLISQENSWATRQVQFQLALVKIKYESGTLMTIEAE